MTLAGNAFLVFAFAAFGLSTSGAAPSGPVENQPSQRSVKASITPQAKLMIPSLNRPALRRVRNPEGRRLTFEISGEKAGASEAGNGLKLMRGLAASRHILAEKQDSPNRASYWLFR